MISLEVIEQEIEELESTHGETTYSLCERLAWLYVVRDHLRPTRELSRTTQTLGGTEFLEVTSGVSYPMLMRVLDEHMSALKVVQPREYEAVIDKIKELH